MTGTPEEQPQTARARTIRGADLDVPEWMTIPAQDRCQSGMAIARGARQQRAATAARQAIELAHHLASRGLDPYRVPESVTWNVRGEPRTRATFADPQPGDYPGAG